MNNICHYSNISCLSLHFDFFIFCFQVMPLQSELSPPADRWGECTNKFRGRPLLFLNLLRTFNLRPMSRGKYSWMNFSVGKLPSFTQNITKRQILKFTEWYAVFFLKMLFSTHYWASMLFRICSYKGNCSR